MVKHPPCAAQRGALDSTAGETDAHVSCRMQRQRCAASAASPSPQSRRGSGGSCSEAGACSCCAANCLCAMQRFGTCALAWATPGDGYVAIPAKEMLLLVEPCDCPPLACSGPAKSPIGADGVVSLAGWWWHVATPTVRPSIPTIHLSALGFKGCLEGGVRERADSMQIPTVSVGWVHNHMPSWSPE